MIPRRKAGGAGQCGWSHGDYESSKVSGLWRAVLGLRMNPQANIRNALKTSYLL